MKEYLCPECGCNYWQAIARETRKLHYPSQPALGPQGRETWAIETWERRICTACGHKYEANTETRAVTKAEYEASFRKEKKLPVIFQRIRCTHCASDDVYVTRTGDKVTSGFRTRYHKCRACDATFTSLEPVSADNPA